MNQDDIIRMAMEAGGTVLAVYSPDLERFAALVAAAERQKVAAWMTQRSYATGHGDTTENLLDELVWQISESERKAMMQLFTDPENQPTQHGTVTVEYMKREITEVELKAADGRPQSSMAWQEGYEAGKQAERDACARLCDDMVLYTGFDCAAAIRARGNE